MTDRTSDIAGDVTSARFGMTCILQEGALTAGEGYNPNGQKVAIATPAAPIAVNDLVYIIAGTKNLGVETRLNPVVAKLVAGTFYVGVVTSTPRWVNVPAESMAFTDCDNANWAAILAGRNYRKATVEFFGVTGSFDGVVTADGTKVVVAGDPTSLKWDVTAGTYIPVNASGGGTGLLPMHYVPTGVSGDTYSIQIGILATSIVAV